MMIQVNLHRKAVGGLTNVVHSPERLQPWRERSPYKVIVTLCIALVLLGGVVHTGVGGVFRGVLLLSRRLYKHLQKNPLFILHLKVM